MLIQEHGKITLTISFRVGRVNRVKMHTVPLEVSQALEKNGTYGSGCSGEVLEAHDAQLPPVKVKVLEGNAGGINLVHVQRLLEPFPHLVLGPVLWMKILRPEPAHVTGCHCGCKLRENGFKRV